ncbi:hypothetical protein NBRC116493_27790 [Aurantivibrio infirmus]
MKSFNKISPAKVRYFLEVALAGCIAFGLVLFSIDITSPGSNLLLASGIIS